MKEKISAATEEVCAFYLDCRPAVMTDTYLDLINGNFLLIVV